MKSVKELAKDYVKQGNYLIVTKNGKGLVYKPNEFHDIDFDDQNISVKKGYYFIKINRRDVFKLIEESRQDEVFVPTKDVGTHGWNSLSNSNMNLLFNTSFTEFYQIKKTKFDLYFKSDEQMNNLILKQLADTCKNLSNEIHNTNLQNHELNNKFNEILSLTELLNENGIHFSRNEELINSFREKTERVLYDEQNT